MTTFIKTSNCLKAACAAFGISISVSMSFQHCLGHRVLEGSEASAWRRLVRQVACAIKYDRECEYDSMPYPWKSYGPDFISATSVLKGIGYGIEKLPGGFRSWIQIPEELEGRSLHKELLNSPEWEEVSEDTLPTVREDWDLEEWCDGLGLSNITAFQAWCDSIENPSESARKEAVQTCSWRETACKRVVTYYHGIDTFEVLSLPRAKTLRATELTIASLRIKGMGVVRRGLGLHTFVGVEKLWVGGKTDEDNRSHLYYIRKDRSKAWDGDGYPLPIKEYCTCT